MGEVRKLQKKLRQIENLEIIITLTPEERFKISRKAELRSRLAELLLQLSGPQQTPGIVGDTEKEKMKRQVSREETPEAVSCQTPPAPKIPKEGPEPQPKPPGATHAANQRSRATGGGDGGGGEGGASGRRETAASAEPSEGRPSVTQRIPKEQEPEQEPESEQKDAALQALWEKAKFRLRSLEGHSDIITCVVAVDNLVISGSRDTTVKVWHVPMATEQRNLGGHSGGVTCLAAPPVDYCRRLARSLCLAVADGERFILSGSTDCCVKIWSLSTGQCVKSIYTFNPVTALCFLPEGKGCIITGSDGGKVQAWSWLTMDNCQAVNAHREAITSIQSQGPLVFSGSAEGGVSVWENHCSERDPLRLLQHWDAAATGCGGQGGRLALSPRGDRVFVADGRACLRILHWKSGVVSKLTNHSSVAGLTDCVHQTPGLLIGSCYDLANGDSTLNLFSLPRCRYLASLTCADAPRILCFAAWLTGSGGHRWVTGGRELTVWEQLPGTGKQRGDVTARRDCRLDASLMESEGETADEESDDYEEEEEDYDSQDASAPGSSSWLRCVLQ